MSQIISLGDKFKGKRIRSSDENLVMQFLLGTFLFIFCLCFSIFNAGSIRSFLNHENSFVISDFLKSAYTINTAIFSCLVAVGFLLSIYCFKRDYLKKLLIRQKLSQLIIYNNLCDVSTEKSGGWFKDISFSDKKTITFFPKIYFRTIESLVIVQVEIVMKSYQEQLSNLSDKLEPGLFCEVVSKELKNGFTEYVLLCDMLNNRISIDEVEAKNGSLRLMKHVWWKYDKLPHMLVCGGTGGGKSYFILTLIETLLRSNADITVLDPKNADLADLGTVMSNVYYTKEDMIEQINLFCDEMLERSAAMKTMNGYKTGENYAYLGLAPRFLIFDEYVAFMEMLGSRESMDVISKLKQIVMLGRQAGYFLIMACQRPDAKYFGEGIRDQFHFRVALGRMSEIGYNMMFGETNKKFFCKDIPGRGYMDNSSNVITEFYTPTVPNEHDFLKTIGELARKRQVGAAACEADSRSDSADAEIAGR